MAFTITTAMAAAAARRFWAKVHIGPGCWEWTAGKHSWGYGAIMVKTERAKRMAYAHRISYVLHHGEIPDGLLVRHVCDNPGCVNPDHLLLGTQADNMADKVRRGRHHDQRGEKSHKSKLRDDDIRSIRNLLATGHTQQSVADLFGVDARTINYIALGKTWSHVT